MKKGMSGLFIIMLITSLGIYFGIKASAESDISNVETIDMDANRKTITISGVIITAKQEIMCSVDNPAMTTKHCTSIITVNNTNPEAIRLRGKKLEAVYRLMTQAEEISYSTDYTSYNEQIINSTCLNKLTGEEQIKAIENGSCNYNVRRYNFTNWKPLDSLDSIPRGVTGARIFFDSPITKTGNTYDKNSFNFSLLGKAKTFTLDPDISSCFEINASGTYTLTANVNSIATCFTFNSPGIILDCNGYMINFSQTTGTGGSGINITGTGNGNAVIKNCNIQEGNIPIAGLPTGIRVPSGSDNISIYNNTIRMIGNTDHAIQSTNADSFTIFNNTIIIEGINSYVMQFFGTNRANITNNTMIFKTTADTGTSAGIFLNSSNNNTIANNTITANNRTYGFLLDISADNTFYNNLLNTTNINVKLAARAETRWNNWNITNTTGTNIAGGPNLGGNFYANYSNTSAGFSITCTDADADGFCDTTNAYDVNNTDYLPLAVWVAPPPSDTCTYSGSGLWNIKCDDNCSITSNVNLNNNNLTFNNSGTFNTNANITNFNQIVVSSGCLIAISLGNYFG